MMDKSGEYKTEIRRTFALVKPIATEAAAIFYSTLFEVDPSTKVRLVFCWYFVVVLFVLWMLFFWKPFLWN